MNIGILGTGTVGRTLAAKLVELGHSVLIGTRNPARTLAQSEPDRMGNPPFGAWLKDHSRVSLVTFAAAAAHGEIVINATNGSSTLDALKAAGESNLNGKLLIDVSNPLDFSRGMPATLFVNNTDSLAEQIQRAFPKVKVVKTLNTMSAAVMVNPRQLADAGHSVFVSGDDPAAKSQVTALLRSFGWEDVIDLGDVTSARGAEMVLPLWLRLMMVQQTPRFNFKIVR